ncbi:19915_t:CDS:2, partial [Dentiscutata erythropus]
DFRAYSFRVIASFVNDLQQHQEHIQKFAYETFLHQNRYTQDDKDVGLEKLHSVCSRFAFDTYVKQQRDLVIFGEYGVFKHDGVYDIIELDSEYTEEVDNTSNSVSQLTVQIFKKLPECYHGSLFDIMQSALEYILKSGKIPELQKDLDSLQGSIFETTNIDNITNYKEIKIPVTKRQRGRPRSNKRICSADKVPKAEVKKKKKDNNLLPHLPGINFDSHIPLNVISE